MGRGCRSAWRRVLPSLTALTGLFGGPGVTPAWAQMPDSERQEMIGRVDTGVSDAGIPWGD